MPASAEARHDERGSTMPHAPSVVVVIRTMHPALESVVRVAASAVERVDRIITAEQEELSAAVSATPGPIVIFDIRDDPTLSEVRSIRALDTDPRVVLLID